MAMVAATPTTEPPFHLQRLGIIMQPQAGTPHEAWGTLNPGGARSADGAYYLFPRLVAEGNYSRIGRARVVFDAAGRPVGVERLGEALEPQEPYEVNRLGGGVEDPRVTYVRPLGLFVMTYTAFLPPHHPRIALAVSSDLVTWERLGPLHYAQEHGTPDLNRHANKDGVLFSDLVQDPLGRPALALLHRPTYGVWHSLAGAIVTPAPSGTETEEYIWISYIALDGARADLQHLTQAYGHRPVMAPQAEWERLKIGAGAPPVLLPYGWLLLYHGVSGADTALEKHVRYCAGAAILDRDDPTRVLYRSPRPILEPEGPQETQGSVPGVVFPTAIDRRVEGHFDVYYGAADTVIGVARLGIPPQLPAQGG
jgi:predicted GH43/DUF377 family glycosyl hydrolase